MSRETIGNQKGQKHKPSSRTNYLKDIKPKTGLTRTTTSTPACTSRSSLYLSSVCVPMAAPQSSCLRESFEAKGKSRFFFRSVRAIMATKQPSSFTIGSLPMAKKKHWVRVSHGGIILQHSDFIPNLELSNWFKMITQWLLFERFNIFAYLFGCFIQCQQLYLWLKSLKIN